MVQGKESSAHGSARIGPPLKDLMILQGMGVKKGVNRGNLDSRLIIFCIVMFYKGKNRFFEKI
jgi:hypothetical protein